MSIEAMKQVIELYDKHCYNNDYGGIEFSKKHGYKFIEAIEALRAAIQQAESEPVAWMWKFKGEEGAAFSSKEPTLSIRDGVSYVPLYTHPASGVPDDVVRDAKRYLWLRSEHERNDPICHLTWKRNMDRSEWRWVNTSVIDSSIDAAMLATQAQKGQP